MKLPFRPASMSRRHHPPAEIAPFLDPEPGKSTKSKSSTGRIGKSKVVKPATKTNPGASRSVSEIFGFLEYHLGVNQEEVQRSVREARKQPRQSIRRALRSEGGDEIGGVPVQISSSTTVEIPIPIYLHVSFKSLKSNTALAPTVMVMLEDLPDVTALCTRLTTKHCEVIGKQLFDSKGPKKWIFESKAGEEDKHLHSLGQTFSKVCSHRRAERICTDFFHFLTEMRRVKTERLTQEEEAEAEAGQELKNSKEDSGRNDGGRTSEREVPKVPLVEDTAIDGFVEVYF
ncbi:hypothetical protein CLAIMM_02587 [Cladophialophora immunda]|nr:hypothetical protein CLAIMM_02587 [Cladophialophora immunda]